MKFKNKFTSDALLNEDICIKSLSLASKKNSLNLKKN